MKAKKLSRRGARSGVRNSRQHLSLVKIPARQSSVENSQTVVESTARNSMMTSAVGIAVGSEYGNRLGVGMDTRQSTKRSKRTRKKKGSVVIIAGPKDLEASNFASSLASKYDVTILSKIDEAERLVYAKNADVLIAFMSKINEARALKYIERIARNQEREEVLVMVASHHEKLEDRLQYYWAGVDTHLLLPASAREMDQIVNSWGE